MLLKYIRNILECRVSAITFYTMFFIISELLLRERPVELKVTVVIKETVCSA